jgi:type IV pilus assembly protein PilM
MATARFAWGIDVGNRALKAVKLVREGDGIRIDDFEVIEHETVLSNAGDNKESLIQTALAGFVQRHPMKGGFVGAGVSGQSSFARFIKLPPVEPKKIPEIVRFEAIQQIPFPLDDVEWSYQLFQSPESPDVEVGIFAMRKELVNQHIKYFTDIDLNVTVVQMNPLAVYNALQHDGRFDQGTTMVIDLGAENTDLLIADNDSIWMRSIPIGGNNFTETLVKAFKLNFTKAEDLKRNAATSKYARQIFQAMRPIFADLVAEIQRSIGFYSSVHRDSRIKKVLALGGTFKLPGLQKYLQQNLQMDVERLDNLAAGAPSDAKLVPTFNENLLSVVSAYGLALQAMGDTKIGSSLLPQAIRRERMWQEKTKWFGAAAALFVIGTGLVGAKYLYQDFQFNNNHNAYAEQINKVKAPATDLDSKWSTIEGSGGTEREQVKNIRELDKYRTMWRNLTIDLQRALPQVPKKTGATTPPISADDIKKTPRAQRKMVLIDSINSRFVDNLKAYASASDFEKYAGGDPNAAPPTIDPNNPAPAVDVTKLPNTNAPLLQDNQRGYLITLKCTSPFANAMQPQGLIEKDLINSLLNIKPNEKNPKMEYAVVRVTLAGAKKVRQDQERLTRVKAEYDAAKALKSGAPAGAGATGAAPSAPSAPQGGGYPGGYPQSGYRPPYPGVNPSEMERGGAPGGAAAPVTDAELYKDPLTEEPVLDDWEFNILIAVVIDPPAFTPQPAGQQASSQ